MAAPFVSHRMQRLHTDSGVVMALFWVQTPDRQHHLAVTVCPACPPALLHGPVLTRVVVSCRMCLMSVSGAICGRVVELCCESINFIVSYSQFLPAFLLHMQNGLLTHSVGIARHWSQWNDIVNVRKESCDGRIRLCTLTSNSGSRLQHHHDT